MRYMVSFIYYTLILPVINDSSNNIFFQTSALGFVKIKQNMQDPMKTKEHFQYI